MSRIDQTFLELKSRGHMAFMPFVTAGDPNMDATCQLIGELARRGVDLIEVGFPYSDPIADGPVIQASYTRALGNGLHVDDIFDGIASLPADQTPPLVAMVAYAIIFRTGAETFLERARQAAFSGLIVPDLPGDEADDFTAAARERGLNVIQLVSPLTPPERVERILRAASGFVYCISVAGTTGVRNELPAELHEQLQWLRTKTDLPLAVGFGVSRPEQVDTLRDRAEGVIVGSALVKKLEPPVEMAGVLKEVGDFAASMLQATRQ